MKKLIYITGEANSFFLNEIQYFTNNFDKTIVVFYDGASSYCDALARRYGFEYVFLKENNKNSNKIAIWGRTIGKLKDQVVREEILCNLRWGYIDPRILYIFFYLEYLQKLNDLLDKEIKSHPLDSYYVYSFWLSRGAFGAANLRKYPNVKKAISRAHGYDLYPERNKLNYLPFRKYIAQSLDAVYFISQHGRTYFKEYCQKKGYYKNNFSKFRLSRLGVAEEKPLLYKKGSTIAFASCSDIIGLKRLDLIIKIVKHIKNLHGDILWIHIGSGKDERKIKQCAHKYLGDRAKFLGNIENSKLSSIYQKYNVAFFINMSDYEGIPVSIMEAQRCGIPCIARRVGGIPEIIKDGINGIVIDEAYVSINDVDALAKKVIRIWKDEDTYFMMREESAKECKAEYNIKLNVEELIKDFIGQR